MTRLRRMTAGEFDAWLPRAIADYAAAKVGSGQWREETSQALSSKEHEVLLPRGLESDGHHLFTIVDADAGIDTGTNTDPNTNGAAIGSLWFAVQTKFGLPIAYVYNVEVAPEHRCRGHAQRAFEALETEVAALGLHGVALHVFGHNTAARALYAKLGYEPTNINLFKHVPVAAA